MTDAEQAERLVFMSCVCSFDDTCRKPFTITTTAAGLERMRTTGRWPRSCGAHPTEHERVVARNTEARNHRREQAKKTLLVSGWCRSAECGNPFTVVLTAGSVDEMLRTGRGLPYSCSHRCSAKILRAKHRAHVAEEAPPKLSVVWPVPCRACWKEQPAQGEVMCTWCRQAARRCCFGKSRYEKETADKRARVSSDVAGETIVPYRCPMCERWHIGHLIPAAQAKRVRFTVAMYRDLLSHEEWQRICKSFAPLTRADIRNRARQNR